MFYTHGAFGKVAEREMTLRSENRMDVITSKERCDQVLGEIRKADRGHMVFVTDENGAVIRHPMKLSDFDERPRFHLDKTLKHDQTESRYQKLRFPKNFKHELLKAFVYQLGDMSTKPDKKLHKRKNKGGKKRGRRY